LERRAKILNETLQDLTRKRQLLISPSTPKGIYDFPSSGNLPS
jgi:hypothetical protein